MLLLLLTMTASGAIMTQVASLARTRESSCGGW
jgi:hypothetical protein